MSSMSRSIRRGMVFSKLSKKQRNNYLAITPKGKRTWNKKPDKKVITFS